MSDSTDAERFAEIVAGLTRDDPDLGGRITSRAKRRFLLAVGLGLCLVAVLLFLFAGVGGMVVAVVPWFTGLLCVVGSRVWR